MSNDEGEPGSFEPIQRAKIEKHLRDLQMAESATRIKAAEELGQLTVSNEEIVSTLVGVERNDPNGLVREAASKALLAPAHQAIVQQHPDLAARITAWKSAKVEKATFWRRLGAFTIDGIVLSLVDGLISGLASKADSWLAIGLGIIGVVVPIVYFVWPYSRGGRTLGKAAAGIKVVSIDGSPLDWRKGILRSVGYIASSIPFDLGFLWSIWDADKQAWHDKMAGTCVVRASVSSEQLLGTIDPAVASRRQKRWLLGLGIPMLLILGSLAVGSFFLVQSSISEVKEMEPWPGSDVPPKEVAMMDLSHLGLRLGEAYNARSTERWKEAHFKEGVTATYYAEEKAVAQVSALRYADRALAKGDWDSVEEQTEKNCGTRTSVTLFYVGIVHCGFRNGYFKILWNDYWMVDIIAIEGTTFTPPVLVDKVRDAMATQWKERVQP